MSDIESTRENNRESARVGDAGARAETAESNPPLSVRIGYGMPDNSLKTGAAGGRDSADNKNLPSVEVHSGDQSNTSGRDLQPSPVRAASEADSQVSRNPYLNRHNEGTYGGSDSWQRYSPYQPNNNPYDSFL